MAEPTITHRAVHDSGGGNLPVRRIVIHATCPGRVPYPAASARGTASGTARYFQDRNSGGSAHYIYDAAGGAEHCVPDATIAWHAPPNSHSIGIEICGQSFYSREQWLSAAVWPAVAAAAARTRELCSRHGVPVRHLSVADLKAGKAGICGHIDVSNAFRLTDHSDPGPHFPWQEFMAAVRGDQKIEEDDVPEYVSAGLKGSQTIKPGRWTHVDWPEEFADAEHQHANEGGWSLLWGPARYSLTVGLTIRGLAVGAVVRVRAVEADKADAAKVDGCPVQEFTAHAGDNELLYALPADVIGKDRRLRVQVRHDGQADAAVVAGSAKVLYWRT